MPMVMPGLSSTPESHLLPSPKETNVSVSVKLRVTNQEFTDDLRNESSEVYKSFVLRFTLQVGCCSCPSGVFSVLVRGVLALGGIQGGEGTCKGRERDTDNRPVASFSSRWKSSTATLKATRASRS